MGKKITICIFTFLLTLGGVLDVNGQFKQIQVEDDKNYGNEIDLKDLVPPSKNLLIQDEDFVRPLNVNFHPQSSSFTFRNELKYIVKNRDKNNMPIWVEGKLGDGESGLRDLPKTEPLQLLSIILPQNVNTASSFEIIESELDEFDQEHFRFKQHIYEIPVFGGDSRLHLQSDGNFIYNGRVYEVPENLEIDVKYSAEEALSVVESDFSANDIYNIPSADWDVSFAGDKYEKKLVWWPFEDDGLMLVWHVIANPNYFRQWNYFICAKTGRIVYKYSKNGFVPDYIKDNTQNLNNKEDIYHKIEPLDESVVEYSNSVLNDGPATANAVDLDNKTVTINTYRLNNVYYLVDASQDMYVQGSIQSGDPKGIILTVDAKRTSPYNGTLSFNNYTSNNNNWSSRESVSAHNHSMISYQFFKSQLNRKSLDDKGINMVAIINYTDGQGQDDDNAMWHPGVKGIFLGGGTGFLLSRQAAACLDVVGHEFGHGIVHFTAGLIYRNQSGALNESYADIFGALVEGKNWQMAENCANTNLFQTGAMRDLSNPHNGGTNLNTPGWQPSHLNEIYVGSEDNGGVHINSSIGSFIFYKVATNTSVDIAARIFFRALMVYLTQSSEFIDLRKAIVQSAIDIHGEGNVANIVRNACNEVGLLDGQPNNHTKDLQVNPGFDLVALTDQNKSAIYLADGQGNLLADPLYEIGIKSRVSFTDNGQYGVFVGNDKKVYLLEFNYSTGQVQQSVLIDNPIFRNVALAKDGAHLALLTDELNDKIIVYSFINNQFEEFRAYNYTTGPGAPPIYNVKFIDALEWDFNSQYIMYDALNQHGTNRESWDIGFIHVWDNKNNRFANGQVVKLFDDITPDESIGNATFSKNSPYIIAFDYLDEVSGDYAILGYNLETRELGKITDNLTIGYPSFSKDDKKLIFDGITDNGSNVLAIINLGNNKITSISGGNVFINGGSWGVWYANGNRVFTNTKDISDGSMSIDIFPNPVLEELNILVKKPQVKGRLYCEIYNVAGQRVFETELDVNGHISRIGLEDKQMLQGMYFLKISDDNGLLSTLRFVKI